LQGTGEYGAVGIAGYWWVRCRWYCRVLVSTVPLILQGTGEPPLLLSCAVFYAVRSAIKSARADAGLPSQFDFDSPATVHKILLACCTPWLL